MTSTACFFSDFACASLSPTTDLFERIGDQLEVGLEIVVSRFLTDHIGELNEARDRARIVVGSWRAGDRIIVGPHNKTRFVRVTKAGDDIIDRSSLSYVTSLCGHRSARLLEVIGDELGALRLVFEMVAIS